MKFKVLEHEFEVRNVGGGDVKIHSSFGLSMCIHNLPANDISPPTVVLRRVTNCCADSYFWDSGDTVSGAVLVCRGCKQVVSFDLSDPVSVKIPTPDVNNNLSGEETAEVTRVLGEWMNLNPVDIPAVALGLMMRITEIAGGYFQPEDELS